jgi:predicted molibdopterin-dependent oxidoreductase YjgC
VPLRGQNNVQGGGDMGAIPTSSSASQDVEDPTRRARFEAGVGRTDPRRRAGT